MKKILTLFLAIVLAMSCVTTASAANAECSSADFTDAPAKGHWAHNGIDFMIRNGYMNGTSTTAKVFSPNMTTSRAMIVQILYKLTGQPAAEGDMKFTDAVKGTWYYNAVLWAVQNGIANGTSETTFDPNGNVTREQIATFLFKHSKEAAPDADAILRAFPDASKVSSWAKSALAWAVHKGIITGKSKDGRVFLDPQGFATRAEVATMNYRYIAEPTEIEFWTFQELHVKFYEEMAAQWNEKNPNRPITIKPTVYPFDDMHNKLRIALQSGVGAPDLVDIEISMYPRFLKGDIQLEPLNDIVEPELDNIVKARVDVYSKDNNYYGICFQVGAAVIYYNAELCEKAGIDHTTITTWDEYYDAGKQLKAAFPNKYWASVETTDIWHMWPLLAELDGDMTNANNEITIDTPEMAQVLAYNRKLIDEDIACVAPGNYHHAEDFYALMNGGNVASIVMPMWYMDRFTSYMPDLSGKIAIEPLPVWEVGQNRSIGQGGTGTSVTNQADNPVLVKEFLAFAKLSQEGGIQAWEMCGFDPIRTDVWSMDEVTHAPNKFTEYYINNPFDTLLEIKYEIVSHNNGENLIGALDAMKTTVLDRAYTEEHVDIPAMLAEEQAKLQ